MSASIYTIAKGKKTHSISQKEFKESCVAEERVNKFKKSGKGLSTSEREQVAINLEKILIKHKSRNPNFKRSSLLKHINVILQLEDPKAELDEFQFSKWLSRVTLKEEKQKNNNDLYAKIDRYILFTEAFRIEANETTNIYTKLTSGTKFHHGFISESHYENNKVIATRIFDRIMYRIGLMDKKHGILQTFKQINELVINYARNSNEAYWPLFKDDTPRPNYNFFLSYLFPKQWLKENEIEDVPIQNADLEVFHPCDRDEILRYINEEIFEPEFNFQRITKPMGVYHLADYFDFDYIKDMPHFYLGGSLRGFDAKDANWFEFKTLTGYTQREIDKRDIGNAYFPWAYIVLYPNLEGNGIIPLYIEAQADCPSFSILDVDEIVELLDSQIAQPNKKWNKKDILPKFWELLLDSDEVYFESMMKSFETTVLNLKNHPLLTQAKNLKTMADKFTERFNEEKL